MQRGSDALDALSDDKEEEIVVEGIWVKGRWIKVNQEFSGNPITIKASVKYINTDIFVTTDADTRLDKHFVKNVMEKLGDEKTVGVCGFIESEKDNFYIHCAGGYRSVIAASILKARGFHNVIDVAEGYAAIKKTNLKRTSKVCPSGHASLKKSNSPGASPAIIVRLIKQVLKLIIFQRSCQPLKQKKTILKLQIKTKI